jgi:hypothetical protein
MKRTLAKASILHIHLTFQGLSIKPDILWRAEVLPVRAPICAVNNDKFHLDETKMLHGPERIDPKAQQVDWRVFIYDDKTGYYNQSRCARTSCAELKDEVGGINGPTAVARDSWRDV